MVQVGHFTQAMNWHLGAVAPLIWGILGAMGHKDVMIGKYGKLEPKKWIEIAHYLIHLVILVASDH